MSETLLPLREQEWRNPAVDHVGAFEREHPSIMTTLGLAEGDVLLHLETHGPTSLRAVARALSQPAQVVTMAVGSLIRKGLIRGVPHELELVLEPVAERSVRLCTRMLSNAENA